ncbi:MAG: transcription-repair coupling factor [Desulfobacula sp.]|uniref:transcription-repair coupling factor n=1 Tax=Desulfobacula sp. TaxID=2593537 RepID=UPI001D72517E|nr:transcription-repair coupling factor [Desulfobacula sp.]MBT3485437.1 transcription-repair coupling factor [Desulfobacula sp.]MBT3805580.1 transcription-repair coupling factor [Desulfobacula sp.]MBT4026076.1 transcription-repair coupling factor [Desulfobacula sp.]MBT4199976.1 transcription-repair coupling factor [Desulfobacula sp.]
MSKHLIKDVQHHGSSVVITPAEGSHKAYMTSNWYSASDVSILVVLRDTKKAHSFLDELFFFLPDKKDKIVFFPGYHILPFKSLAYHKETSTNRLAALSKIMNSGSQPLIIVTVVDTILQKLIPRKNLTGFAELVIANEEIDRDILILKLESGGYNKTSLVEDPGEYSVRGGILDVFSPGEKYPVRIEFFGDLVESIRYFSVFTQRGIKEIYEIIIIPATEAILAKENLPHIMARLRQAGTLAGLAASKTREYVNETREFGRFPGVESMLSIVYEKLDTFFDYIPEDTILVMDSPGDLEAGAIDFESKAFINYKTTSAENRLCVEPDSIYLKWDKIKSIIKSKNQISFESFDMTNYPSHEKQVKQLPFEFQDNADLSSSLKREGTKENPLTPLVDWFKDHRAHKRIVLCVLSQESQSKRLLSLLQPYGIEPVKCSTFKEAIEQKPGIYYLFGALSSGFIFKEESLALVTENEIFGKKRIRRQRKARRDLKTKFITPEELKNGDIVVHIDHGVGQFEGLCSLKVGNISQDFILIQYLDKDKLYLPVDRIEMIGKYIGVDGYKPILDKIGSKAWIKSKAKAKEEVEKLAADLLNLYAKRKVNKGFSFSRPDNYYNDFEAAFPYDETRDQLKAIDDVHLDMESSIPMDRLVCGDVGYGKTEVAIRAAFKGVNDGKQVAIVVPTTILAEQHLSTFRERFAQYPVNIECLSRFRTRKEQTKILKAISSGKVDIVIGTHRLLQKDVDFKSLGLLVIDEEQRFGVKHKEALKKKRSYVDVLALTATPIPRTLHMSLTGMRDISLITTPPADRQPIISYISKYEDPIAKDAIKRELSRKGQIFFVHNNIKTIFKAAHNLEKLVPEAKIGVAHGRLSETELEKVMLKFVNFEIDVLVCTTIIESGLDIPSANTMIINKAERFGLSQIYQLRGRIGRGDHQAYAYLFISDENTLTKDAKKRLSALMEYKDLGSGFQIAMKDLQIRGAGTALGASQSGHIAAVGYDMFLKLLDQAVHDLKGEEIVEPLEPEINASMSSGFPDGYIESVEQRLTLYRRLSRITRVSDISDMKKELMDRYGKLPREAENMLLKIMLRVYCIKAGVQRLDITPNTLTLCFSEKHRKKPLHSLNKDLKGIALFKFIKKDSIKIQLGRKRNNISKALLETRNILKSVA